MAPPTTMLPCAPPVGSNDRSAIAVPSGQRIVSACTSTSYKDGAANAATFRRLYLLEDPRGTLAHANAHRDHAVLQILALQRVHHCRRPDSAGGAERMAERDRAAHWIDLGSVEAKCVDHR